MPVADRRHAVAGRRASTAGSLSSLFQAVSHASVNEATQKAQEKVRLAEIIAGMSPWRRRYALGVLALWVLQTIGRLYLFTIAETGAGSLPVVMHVMVLVSLL